MRIDMKTSVAAFVFLMASVVSAQFPPGWNYNPYLYYPYTAQQPPVQETPEVAAARSAHLAIHALAKASRPAAAQPTPIAGHPSATSVTSNAWASQANHHGHQSASASAFVTTSAVPQQVQETPEVAAARRAHMAAHALAAARVVKITPAPTAVASQQFANSVTATTNELISNLSSFFPVANWGPPQPVQDSPEVQAAKLAFFRAFREAFFRSG